MNKKSSKAQRFKSSRQGKRNKEDDLTLTLSYRRGDKG